MSPAVALALMLLASREGAGDKIDCKQGFEALRKEALAMPDVKTSTQPGFDIYDGLARTGYMYVLTTADHPAYPTVIRRRIFEQDGQVMLMREACGYGDREPFERVMRHFEANDAAIQDRLNAKPKP